MTTVKVEVLWAVEMRVLGSLVFGALLAAAHGMGVKESWGYVPVRRGAYMFWWLYLADHPTTNYTQQPLVLWLQGGPGASGCGYGNFEEIGPLDTDLNPRSTSWVSEASLLFVDNPVGTGFSYVTDSGAYTRDVDMVAVDMMVLLKQFFSSKSEFQNIPFYIFSESYGGKMAAAVSLALHKGIQSGVMKCNFRGVALGDSWISPVDSVMSWGPYLYSISLLDEQGLKRVQEAASDVQDAISRGEYELATDLWSKAENVIEENADNVNFYNILTKDPMMAENQFLNSPRFADASLGQLFQRHLLPFRKDRLYELMNGPIRKKLQIIPDDVTWGGQSGEVFSSMAGDFMKPVVDMIDELLNAGVNVTVYNGQLDLIVDTVGQESWVKKLKWPKMSFFKDLKWTPLHMCADCSDTTAFHKSYENFHFYWILRAGHMVPSDQGATALTMLRMIIGEQGESGSPGRWGRLGA